MTGKRPLPPPDADEASRVFASAHLHDRRADWSTDLAAYILVLVCAWNLNGVLWLTFNLEQVASTLMLVTSMFLILRCGRLSSAPLRLLIVGLCSYLALSTIYNGPETPQDVQPSLYISYSGTIFLLWALTGYVANLQQDRRRQFLRFVRNALTVSAGAVWLSPLLYQFYWNLPLSASQRMGGLFANPNEAAYVSLLALAFSLHVPYERTLATVVAASMTAGAVVLTLSKTGMSMMVVAFALYFVRRAKGWGLFLIIISATVALVLSQDLDRLLSALVDQPFLELSSFEKERIISVANILQGQIDDQTSTGRTALWTLAFERAWSNFPLGAGMGSAHYLIGGILENNVWQGAHNVFLMLWVESGVIPPLLVFAAVATAAWKLFSDRRPPLEFACLLILVAQMLAGHTALSTRYHNLGLAIVLGLQASAARRLGVSAGEAQPGDLGRQSLSAQLESLAPAHPAERSSEY